MPDLRMSAAGDDPLLALAHGVGHMFLRAIIAKVGRSAAPALGLLLIRPLPASIAQGVGYIRDETASISVPPSRPLRGVIRPPLSARLAVGVGQSFTSALSFGSPRLFDLPAVRSIASSATGVCQNPDPLSEMGSAGIGRRNDSPFRIEPHRGQVSENSSESPRSEHWAVFHFNSDGLYLANDPSHLGP
ncbi:hypothetical protein BURKHO8Y_110237 [Burkholderia sp. 8Y]|nr:hypothetical protein BURKHO8Y_110237 [Burkholderia sp. 8Y]